MCKKSLLMMLLLALLVPWAANAQTTVEIGDGTAGSNRVPIDTYYNYSISEQLYTADEIGTAGTITSISFNYINSVAKDFPIEVYMKNVDAADLSTGISLADAALVFEGTLSVSETGWVTIDLGTPFDYDGTSNLLIGINKGYVYWFSGNSWQGTTTNTTMARYSENDNNAYDTSTTPSSTSSVRPNIQMEITPAGGATCDKPATLVVSDITGYGATCTWESNVGNYTFEYKKAADSEWTVVTGLTTNTYTLSNLESMTAYNTRVKAVCGAGLESGYKTANFTTLDVCPNGKVCIGEGTATNTNLPTNNYYNYSLTEQIYTTAELGEAALIESVDIYSVGSVTRNLEIYMVNTEKITFDTVTDWIPATEGDLVFSGSVAFAANSWNTMEFSTPFIYNGRTNVALIVRDVTGSWVSATNFFVFNTEENQSIRAARDGSTYDIAAPGVNGTLAKVKNRVRLGVSELPSCFQPSGLTVSNIGARSVELSWTENGEATAWQIGYQVVGGTEQYVEVSTNPYTLTGLTPDTDYEVRVQSKCSDTEYSTFTSFVSFTTEVACPAPTNFAVSDITAFSANVSWNALSNVTLRYVANPNFFFQGFVTDAGAMADGADASWIKGASTTWGPSGNYAGGYYLADDFTVNTATSLTEIEVYGYQTGSTTESTFTGLYAMILSGNPMEGTVDTIWGDMTTNLMTSTSFTNCYRGSDGQTTATTRPIMAVTASGLNINLAAGTYWLVYGMTGTLSSGPWGVPYSDPVVGNIGDGLQYSSSGWAALTDSGSGAYGPAMKLIFGDIESFDWTTVNNISTGEYAMTNLDPETLYLVQVRANCGSEGNSNWVSTTFTTLPSCLFPTDLAVSNIEARQAVLAWTENGDATAWEVEVVGNTTTVLNATQNPYTLTGLNPETRYTVRVRSKCSNTDFSEWSLHATFTTDVACHAPTNLAFADITRISANVSWDGEADSYEMEYATGGASYLTYDFEDGTLQGWTNLIVNTDGGEWLHSNDNGGGYDYTTLAHSGTGFATCYSYVDGGSGAFDTDAYLVSPTSYSIDGNASLNFWYDMANDSYPEDFEVCVATVANPTASDFTAIWASGTAKGNNDIWKTTEKRQRNTRYDNWREVTLDLNAYAGQSIWIAFHDVNYDAYEVWIDDITVNTGIELIWTPVGTVTSPYLFNNLDPETTYMVRVRANCGEEDGYSAWLQGSFTTDVACPTPEALAATPYALSAELSWEGVSESYTVRYGITEVGETLSSFDFEDETIPADFTNSTSYPWTVTEGGADGSGYCVIPGNAGQNSTTSDLTLQLTGPCAVSFMAKVSSENNWDWGRFLIDGTQQMQISGTQDWTAYNYTVTEGTHTLVWRYYKDSSTSSNDDLFYVDNIVINEIGYDWNTTTATTNECVITGLEPATTYYVQVMGDCGDFGTSEWSEMISFTTTEDTCPVPTNLTVNNETLTATTADLSWEGSPDVESFTVRYRAPQHAAEGALYEAFGTSIPTGWTLYTGLLDTVMVRPSALTSATYGWNFGTGNGVFDNHARCNIYGTYQRWLVTPEVTVAAGANLAFDLALTVYTSGSNASPTPGNQADDKFIVLISTDSLQTWTILRQWDNQGSEYVYDEITNDANGQPVSIDLSAYAGQTVHIAFYGESTVSGGDNNLHIDNVIIGEVIPATDWQTVTTTETNVTLTGLTPETPYEAQVKADCSDPEAWSNTVSFTTLVQTTVTQTIALTAGFNWISSYVEITLNDLKAALVEALPGSQIAIYSQSNGNTTYNGSRWRGTLNALDLSQMYKVKVAADCEITLEGMPIDPAEHHATINTGFNWIAFPLSTDMTLTNAFAGFSINGDMVVSQSNGSSTYNNRWRGSLSKLEAGHGYKYKSTSTESKPFTFPLNAK